MQPVGHVCLQELTCTNLAFLTQDHFFAHEHTYPINIAYINMYCYIERINVTGFAKPSTCTKTEINFIAQDLGLGGI